MLERAERIHKIGQRFTEEEFMADELAYEATLRNIEILGEAAKMVPEDVRELAPDIPWRQISKTRDVLAHVYFGVKDEIIWDIVTVKAPDIIPALHALLEELQDEI
jgi:uncharacterized protein with HEPN domain